MFYSIFDVCMAVLMFVFGFLFYKSNGKAANYLSGYNTKTKEEREKYDEIGMCKDYGKRLMYMALPFLLGAVIDLRWAGRGLVIALGLWSVLFVLLIRERYKRER